jgi:hypothetical protein
MEWMGLMMISVHLLNTFTNTTTTINNLQWLLVSAFIQAVHNVELKKT